MVSARTRLLISAGAGGLLGLVAVTAVMAVRFEPLAREYIISTLSERYKSGVELGELHVSLFPVLHATGENLVLRFGNRSDIPPMVRVRKFTLDSNFVSFFRNPRRISRVTLEGLEIHLPPRSTGISTPSSGSASPGSTAVLFVLDEVIADSAVLETTPSDPTKDPLVFRLRELKMQSVGIGQPMAFHAKLENPKPAGLVEAEGKFGPWDSSQPRATPVSGKYTFRNADLSVFKGVSGTLSSDGRYDGPLDRLEVQGTADVPEFALDTADHPIPLHTEFEATVDGTNGDTVLHPVRARLGGGSNFEVSGSVARSALEKNKEIALQAEAHSARLEDFLRLAVKSPKPPMTGLIAFSTNIRIPPGPRSVADRLRLDGIFTLKGVKFTSEDVQGKIAGLSHRAQGDPGNHDPDVPADFRGGFRLRDGILNLPDLHFTLPGTNVAMSGNYGLRTGSLDFKGTVKLDATVSQMTSGLASRLLRPLDPLFRRDGAGTVLPIRVSGTRGSPSFSLKIGNVFNRH